MVVKYVRCLLCDREFTGQKFWRHLNSEHSITLKEYYDIYLREDGEGICPTCSGETRFWGINGGYSKFCGEECRSEYQKGEGHPLYNKKRPNMTGKFNPTKKSEVRAEMSKVLKQLWRDEEFAKRMTQALKMRPNKLEMKLLGILKNLFGDRFKYVGDGQIWIAGKNPDFISSHKEIIELFGEYWHDEKDEYERKKHFGNYGYRTLIIWSEELENLNKLYIKLEKFVS